VVVLAACGRVSSGTAGASPSPARAPLTVSAPTLHDGEVGVAYAPISLEARGGMPPYTWQIANGALPAGVSLTTDGTLFGIPTAGGKYSLAFQVVDQRKSVAEATTWITIAGALTLNSANAVVETGHAGGAYATLMGGLPPYAYTLQSGTLPPGTTLADLALSGTFTMAGTFTFTVVVTDGAGATAKASPTYRVFAPLAFPARPAGQAYDAYCQGVVSTGCTASVPYSGGYPGTTPRLSWYPALVDGTPVDPSTISDRDLPAPTLSGGAVHVVFYSDRTGAPGGTGWDGQVIVTLTDPATGETVTAHVRVVVVWTP
jgi:hypothetical protein